MPTPITLVRNDARGYPRPNLYRLELCESYVN